MRSRRNKSHTRLGATILAVLVAAAVAATAQSAGAGVPYAADQAAPASGSADPATLAAQVTELADTTASQWTAHEASKGWFVDPVLGPVLGDYGVSMTGEALVHAGVDSADQTLVQDGLAAELSEVSHENDGGFELLSLSDAYTYDDANLVGNPAWIAAQPRLASFLSKHGTPISDEGLCYSSPHCYTNLKLVSAVAELALLRTGLSGARSAALLSKPARLRAQTLQWLRMADANAGDDAYRTGAEAFSQAGILSDPDENPLAYHALSTMMLGRAILMLGAQTPDAALAAFNRTAQALVGLMAPDGDDTYIGRGQAQVWTAAATIDALAIAAELTTTDPVWRGLYLNAAAVELNRLETIYPSEGWGFPLVPGFAGNNAPASYNGIDPYADTVEYNGLALWALDDAALQLSGTQPAAPQPLPSESDGAFVDPSHTQFAAVTHGTLWFAIHATDSNPGDARYGFGLLAAELDTADGWQQALPPRPLTDTETIGGLAMLLGRATFFPVGRRISASSSGDVTVSGAWRDKRKVVDLGTVWRFAPTASGTGVTLSFTAKPGAAYALQVWYEAGAQVSRMGNGVSVVEPDGSMQSYLLNTRVRIATSVIDSSAYSQDLNSLVLTTRPASAAQQITYTTLLVAAPTGATGPSGPSGGTGSSGASGASGSSGDTG